MDLSSLTYSAIKNYYNVLSNTGSLKDSQVYKLLILIFIENVFRSECADYITEKDYTLLLEIVDCLSRSSCTIPFEKLPIHVAPVSNYSAKIYPRITQKNIIRFTTEDLIRMVY